MKTNCCKYDAKEEKWRCEPNYFTSMKKVCVYFESKYPRDAWCKFATVMNPAIRECTSDDARIEEAMENI